MGYKFINVDVKGNEQHIHTYNAVPLLGTSTITGIIPPPLAWWASGLAVKELGIPDPKVITKIKRKTATQEEYDECMNSIAIKHAEIKNMETQGFYKLLDKAYRAHSVKLKDSAQKGTDLHAELEKFVKYAIKIQLETKLPMTNITQDCTNMFETQIQPFIDWSGQNIKRFLFSEIHCYSEKYWLGGIADAGAEMNDGQYAIIDFKSSKEAYQSQFWQCAGYDIQLTENGGYTKDGEKIFQLEQIFTQYIIVPFGSIPVVPVYCKYKLEDCKKAFMACVELYKCIDK